MQNNFNALSNKVIGIMVDNFGIRKTANGLIINEIDGAENSIRPRWFKVTHVGPEQNAVQVNDYVLVSHGRWSRGFFIDKEASQKYYHLDEKEILIKTETKPKDI
jgi:hypothetical protein